MKLPEYQAKQLLRRYGIATPEGAMARSVDEAVAVAEALRGPVAVKAQVRSGGRGKAGGIVVVDDVGGVPDAASRLFGMELGDEIVNAVLVERAVDISAEHYLSVTIDPSTGRPMLMASEQGGVEVESMTDAVTRTVLRADDPAPTDEPAAALHRLFTELDALLVEINPLAVTADGATMALDAKIELDDSAAFRHRDLLDELEVADDVEISGTEREQAAAAMGLKLIELGGDIAVLANGAGLTMATMDAIVAAGGAPANFLEIGGDAYTKATPALELVLSQPGVKSLLVNFCGAFARCDVMTAGVIEAWQTLKPDLPVAFSIAGTGMDEAVAMVKDRLGVEPHPSMALAVNAAVNAAVNPAATAAVTGAEGGPGPEPGGTDR